MTYVSIVPTDVNRMGTSTKTSWDSFAYALMMNPMFIHISTVYKKQIESMTKVSIQYAM